MIEANYGLTLASLTYGIGDLGTPGAPGSASLAPSAVPLPAAAWLFITAIIGIFKFIPAQAGISRSPGTTASPATGCCAT
jgi:hypothetical protein